ncbi:MAG: hypothetical protein WCT03_18735 [Candidatus Obscuribacterales bacterium]|jgi:hypothetical protein
MTNLPSRDRSHLQLVVSNVVAANGALRDSSSSSSSVTSPGTSHVSSEERTFNPVRLVRTAESTECADALADAYHRERLITPFRSVLRVELNESIDRTMLSLAISELESRGWTITSATFDEDICNSRALWLRPYA